MSIGNNEMENMRMNNKYPNASISDTAIIHENVRIEDDVKVHDYVVLYPGTVLKNGCEIYDHCTIGKKPTSPGSTLRKYSNDNYETTTIGENSILCTNVVVYTGTTIMNNTLLADNCSIREKCSIGSYCVIGRYVAVSDETEIGNYTKIMDHCHVMGKIGNHVFFGVLVSMTNDNSMGRDKDAIAHFICPTIEDYATIGAGANLLPGVIIGRNSIVGAAALVTKNVPEGKVVMGVPAKIIRDV